jgi:hypothetical protein
MEDRLIMSSKERKRKVIMEDVKRGYISLIDAAPRLGVGYRQAKRIWKKYRTQGDVGIVHKSRGKPSGRTYPPSFKEKVLKLYEDKYKGFGPTFAAEKMEEDDEVIINDETLRLWLLEANLWQKQRKRKGYRKRRIRRERFGELLQIDGSDHQWFGPNYPRSCLLNIVDDATSVTMSQLDHGETCQVLLSTFKAWVKKYGVPKAVYVDLKNVYVTQRRIVDDDIETTMNVFERVCHLLDVEIIKAYSPQAKGRVERNHGIYQDRFVKELQLKNINTIAEANEYLKKDYLQKINKKFAKKPASSEDAHCGHKAYGDLEQIFCWEYQRQMRNDFTVRFNNEFYQLSRKQSVVLRSKQKIVVHVHLDGKISFWKDGNRLTYKKLSEPKMEQQVVSKKSSITSAERSELSKRSKHKSPWAQFNPAWLKGGGRSSKNSANAPQEGDIFNLGSQGTF